MNSALHSQIKFKIKQDKNTMRLAVLIDADNAQASVIEAVLAEVARFGEVSVRRIYGDFTSSHSSSWKNVLQKYAIKPVQQFTYITGKNVTDSALIIDAMDLLYTRRFDGFCLVTSDSDFTGLALRLREEGLKVFGFGKRQTSEAFRNACHKFIFVEVLRSGIAEPEPALLLPKIKAGPEKAAIPSIPAPEIAGAIETEPGSIPPKIKAGGTKTSTHPTSEPAVNTKTKLPTKFMRESLRQSSDENGWVTVGAFGNYLKKVKPEFDFRQYGYKKLSDLVKAKTDLFVVEERPVPGQNAKEMYLKAKENSKVDDRQ